MSYFRYCVHTDKHVRLSFEGRKVQSKVIFDAAFAVVVSLIGILVSSLFMVAVATRKAN